MEKGWLYLITYENNGQLKTLCGRYLGTSHNGKNRQFDCRPEHGTQTLRLNQIREVKKQGDGAKVHVNKKVEA